MRIFLDTANLSEIKELVKLEIIDGVTTNPSLIKKAGFKDLEKNLVEILEICSDLEVSLEVVGTNYNEMFSEAKNLYNKFSLICRKLAIKIPVCSCEEKDCKEIFDSYRVIRDLSNLNIPVNATLIFTPEQAFLCAKAGAKYVSPFLGRADDYVKEGGILSGMELIGEIRNVFEIYSMDCEILAASIRNKEYFRLALLGGANIITVPYSVLKEVFIHDKTLEGVKKFKEDTVKEYESIVRK